MAATVMTNWRQYEGEQVSVALGDGTRLDDCNLVSGGRSATDSLWLFVDGSDLFVPRSDVIDIWAEEARERHVPAAR